jgi:cellulose synthase (UDP-forming)
MSRSESAIYGLLVILWLAAILGFWVWWFRSEHLVSMPGLVLNTVLVAVDLIEPAWFLFFVALMRRPDISSQPAKRYRVAAGTTKTPSEPMDVVGATLLAISRMRGEHDTWLLDEGNDPCAREFCETHGIKYFTRNGVARYQLAKWPFARRMKAGNYNSWLDYVGYDRSYDVFLQFDSDHRPAADYLEKVLPIFDDPQVGYVAAPSICTGNRDASWVVLARAEIETTFHGPLQCGFNSGFAPLIIGSHASFRMSALREIGGFQRTWCEDHDNAMTLNSYCYRGVFQPDAIAVGDGPTSFAEAMQQEYQWARGLVQILLNNTASRLPYLSIGKRLQFLFCQTWYPRISLLLLSSVLLPLVTFAAQGPLVAVDYLEFLARHSVVGVSVLLIVRFLSRRGWTRPSDIGFFSWRTPLFLMLRWPWIGLACLEALMGRLLGRDFAIRVTRKGSAGAKPLPVRTLAPFIAIIALSVAASALLVWQGGPAQSYALIALITAISYTVAMVLVVSRHLSENRVATAGTWRSFRSAVASASVALFATTSALGIWLADASSPQTAVAGEAVSRAETSLVTDRAGGGHLALTVPEQFRVHTSAFAYGVSDNGRIGSTGGTARSVPIVAVAAFPTTGLSRGAYDPAGQLRDYSLDVEHSFLQWDFTASDFDSQIDHALLAGRQPLVSVEPRAWPDEGLQSETLLEDIAVGRYDSIIQQQARVVRTKAPNMVVVRFAQEMELDGVHPWSLGDPPAYVAAYRHYVDVYRTEEVTNATFVWSPAGNRNAGLYYPGGDYVDFVGITILGSSDWDRNWGFTPQRPFRELMDEKYYWGEVYRKPLIVAEAGVAMDDPAGGTVWLRDAIDALDDYPLVRAFIYFNDDQPTNTRFITQFPDWRLVDPGALFDRAR